MNGHNIEKPKEKAIVIGIATNKVPIALAKEHLSELKRLAHTAGAEIAGEILQRRPAFDGSTLIGSGKIRELDEMAKKLCVDLIIFDDDLTGSQVKRIETMVPNVKVLDRSGLILDIFARTAKTAESKIQVEVAQLEYFLPRLTRAWTHLSRQVGGIGLRGPGETQLEVDRRLVRKRISDLKKRLKKIEDIKHKQHERRYPTFHVSLVGYTNAGKSSLMNLLTKAKVIVEDKLFATLDATTRKFYLDNNSFAVLSDTVGFIRKLPHNLIESFKSTLSVVQESSLILHVVDSNDEDYPHHMEVTAEVLSGLKTEHIPRVLVFNKLDLLGKDDIQLLKNKFPSAVYISAEDQTGIDSLKGKVSIYYKKHLKEIDLADKLVPGKIWKYES